MKILSASIALAAAGLLVLVSASPAMAAGSAIDPGDSLYAINCDDNLPDFQLLSVEASTAVSTTIGVGEGTTSNCAGQAAYDSSTGDSYYVRWVGLDSSLAQIDVATGVSTDIGRFFELQSNEPVYRFVESIAIGASGNAYAVSSDVLYSLNLVTAEIVEVGPLETDSLWAFAFDALTGKFYAVFYNTDELQEIDVTDASVTVLGNLAFDAGNVGVNSLQFDESGRAWVEVDNDTGARAGLWSFLIDEVITPVYSGNFSVVDEYYTESLLIIPGQVPVVPEVPVVSPAAPTLPATGTDTTTAILWAGGAAAFLLAGVTLLVVRRRTARANRS